MDEHVLMLSAILDAVPFPIVFVDQDFIIRYLNKPAEKRYYGDLKHHDLTGKCLFDYHKPVSQEKIKEIVKKIATEKQEVFLKVNQYGEKVFVVPVFNKEEQFIGFFERFESAK